MDVLVDVADLNVSFGGRRVLQGLTFQLGRGEIVGVVGSNGSGKTTLLNAIGGFAPMEGSIVLDGIQIADLAPWQRTRAGLSRTLQRRARWSELGLEEALKVRSWCRSLAPRESMLLRFLSTGRSLLAFGSYPQFDACGLRRDLVEAVVVRPKLLLLDEPLAGEGIETAENLDCSLQMLTASGAAVLIVEHQVEFLARLTRRVLTLKDGRLY